MERQEHVAEAFNDVTMEGSGWTVKALVTKGAQRNVNKITLSTETGKVGGPKTLAWQFLPLGVLFCDRSSKNIKTLGYCESPGGQSKSFVCQMEKD